MKAHGARMFLADQRRGAFLSLGSEGKGVGKSPRRF